MDPQGKPQPLPVTILGGLAPGVRDCAADLARIEVPGLAVLAVRGDSDDPALSWRLYDRSGPLDGGSAKPQQPCSPRHLPAALLPVLLLLARSHRHRHLLLTLPPGMEADLVALGLLHAHTRGQSLAEHLRIDTVAVAVDLARIEDDLTSGDLLADHGLALGPHDTRALAQTAARHLEGADVVVTASLNDPDPAASARAVTLVRHLAHRATTTHICHDPLTGTLRMPDLPALVGADLFDADQVWERHGTLPLPAQARAPEYRIHSTHWSARRPLHAQRLYDALEQICAGVLRGRGHLWLATQPDTIHRWESAGEHLALRSRGSWLPDQDGKAWQAASAQRRTFAALLWDPYYGERRNELTFTGIDLDIRALHHLLNSCLLTDTELSLGPARWNLAEDPFAQALSPADPPN